MISATKRTWNTSLAQGYYFPWHVFSYRNDMRYDFTTRMLFSLPCFSVTERAWNMTLRMLFPWHVFSYIQDIKYDFDTRMLFPWHVFSYIKDSKYDFGTRIKRRTISLILAAGCLSVGTRRQLWLAPDRSRLCHCFRRSPTDADWPPPEVTPAGEFSS